MKILLRKILDNCFISFNIICDENKLFKISNAKLKHKKYFTMINVVNKMIEVLFNTNKIIHIDKSIHKLIDIKNNKTQYADIIKIYQNSLLTKNEIEKIKEVFIENKLYLQCCVNELTEKDKELKALLEEFNEK